MRPTMGLAINGDQIAAHLLERLHPLHEAVLELLRVNAGKHAPKCIVRGNTVGQLQEWVVLHTIVMAFVTYASEAL
jgi:hypothetical protein